MVLPLYRRHELAFRTQYAELKERSVSGGRLLPGTPGRLVLRTGTGYRYWYRSYYAVPGQPAEDFVCKDGDDAAHAAGTEAIALADWAARHLLAGWPGSPRTAVFTVREASLVGETLRIEKGLGDLFRKQVAERYTLKLAADLEFQHESGQSLGLAMAEAARLHPGSMAAILGLEDEAVEELCSRIEGVWPANYNCPGQIVVSGENAAVDQLCAEAESIGARRAIVCTTRFSMSDSS